MVIQRIQTLLLLLAAIVMGCFTFCTVGQVSTEQYTFALSSLGLQYEGIATDGAPTGWFQHTWFFFTVSLLGCLLPLISIFFFKNLRFQKQLTLVSALFAVASLCVALTLGYNTVADSRVEWNYGMMCAPVIAVVSLCLAWRYINRDKKLLSSADRLR